MIVATTTTTMMITASGIRHLLLTMCRRVRQARLTGQLSLRVVVVVVVDDDDDDVDVAVSVAMLASEPFVPRWLSRHSSHIYCHSAFRSCCQILLFTGKRLELSLVKATIHRRSCSADESVTSMVSRNVYSDLTIMHNAWWYLQRAAVWHLYFLLCIYILYICFFIASVPLFLYCFFFFFQSGIDKSTEWSTIPASPSLMSFF